MLIDGVAINDAGTILAYSNAGLVLLRPGTQGTDAPVLGPLAGLPFSAEVGQDLHLTLGFADNATTQTHTAAVDWNDGCATPAPVVTEAGGFGQVAIAHRFCGAGYYLLTVRVRDSGDRTTETHAYITVVEPGVPTATGRGTLARAAPGKPLNFTFWAPGAASTGAAAGVASARPGAAPFVNLDGPFQFRSDQVGAPTRTGATMRLTGSGRLNGRAGYRFLADATDDGATAAGSGDRLRVRIVHTDAGGAEVVDYDNGASVEVATAATAVVRRVDRTGLASGDIVLRN